MLLAISTLWLCVFGNVTGRKYQNLFGHIMWTVFAVTACALIAMLLMGFVSVMTTHYDVDRLYKNVVREVEIYEQSKDHVKYTIEEKASINKLVKDMNENITFSKKYINNDWIGWYVHDYSTFEIINFKIEE